MRVLKKKFTIHALDADILALAIDVMTGGLLAPETLTQELFMQNTST
jgi:hypothetical protein